MHVSPIGMGCMPLSLAERPLESTAIRVLHAAMEAGTNFFDTADVYCQDHRDIGHNERLIAKALSQWHRPENIKVATKGGLCRPKGRWESAGRPAQLRKACEKSLRALGVERIFLYQLHAPDPDIPFLDQVAVLKELQNEGKIEHIGLSNVSLAQVDAAAALTTIQTVQNRCHPRAQRDYRNALVSFLELRKISYLPYSPVGGGNSHQEVAAIPVFTELAQKYACSPYAVILNWHLGQGPHVIPIPGASRLHSATDSPSAGGFILSAQDRERIDSI